MIASKCALTVAAMTDVLAVDAVDLTKRFGDLIAVDAISLQVHQGEVYGVLGPNGAGKTTLLRMLFGLIRPDAGTLRVFGRTWEEAGPRTLEGVAGFVESPRFYPYLSGRRNLEGLARLDGGAGADRIDEALEIVDLAGRAGDKVGGYSYGMRQRLGVAASLLRDPRLLVLDEPANGLDPAGMRDMRALIKRLAASGLAGLLLDALLALASLAVELRHRGAGAVLARKSCSAAARPSGSSRCGKCAAPGSVTNVLSGIAAWAARPCSMGIVPSRPPQTIRVGTPASR